MFRNKVVVRADLSNGSTSPFHFTNIHIDDSSSSSPLYLESLCWKLSRTLPIACFLRSPSTIFLVYQTDQASAVKEAIVGIRQSATFSIVEEDAELESPSLVAKAVECGLKSLLLDSGWRSVGESCFVHSTFSTSEEKRHLMAFTLSVQSEKDGGLVFLVSPDVVRFSRFKISMLLSSSNSKKFENGEEVDFDDYNFATSCCSLPSLADGHAIGVRKLLPVGENLLEFEDICSSKHGMHLPNDYFIKIQLPHQGCSNTQWFPSSFVLQGAGFSPAPQSIRISKCTEVLRSFMKIMKEWNFFGQGKLKLKSIVSLTIGSELETWIKTANDSQSIVTTESCNFNINDLNNKLFTSNDFRTPKFISICNTTVRDAENEMTDTNLATSKSILQLPNVAKNTLQSSSISSHHMATIDTCSSDKLKTQDSQSSVLKKRRRSRRIISNLEKLTPSSEESTTEGESQEIVKICKKRIPKGLKRNKETIVIDKKCLPEAKVSTKCKGNSKDKAPLKQIDTNVRKTAPEKGDKCKTLGKRVHTIIFGYAY
ncbi:hypothetical protein ZOSMA_58G00580 [Zostera marina]|uniref:Uncharacterized protein n=1 Tax=Zostera marina TaxID=29655 RepID=A0A0K9NX59_ZOSMR|nr:hypothetical protein ZOSMA_58G00580 [Zostera marina]